MSQTNPSMARQATDLSHATSRRVCVQVLFADQSQRSIWCVSPRLPTGISK